MRVHHHGVGLRAADPQGVARVSLQCAAARGRHIELPRGLGQVDGKGAKRLEQVHPREEGQGELFTEEPPHKPIETFAGVESLDELIKTANNI